MGRKIAMFKVDDVIIYGKKGVCRIEKTEEKIIDGVKRNYFVLKPVNDSGATIFAPTDNEQVLKKMRRLLTRDEVHSLIDAMPDERCTVLQGSGLDFAWFRK